MRKILFETTGGDLKYGDHLNTYTVKAGTRLIDSSRTCNLLIDGNDRLYALGVLANLEEVWLCYSDDEGETWTATKANTTSVTDVQCCDLCQDSGNNIYTAWMAQESGVYKPYWRMFDGDVWNSVFDNVVGSGWNIRTASVGIACNSANQIVVAWGRGASGGADRNIYATPLGGLNYKYNWAYNDPPFSFVALGADYYLIYHPNTGYDLRHWKFDGAGFTWSQVSDGIFGFATDVGNMDFSVTVNDNKIKCALSDWHNSPNRAVYKEWDGSTWSAIQEIIQGKNDQISLGARK
jgi:hypothetical protein